MTVVHMYAYMPCTFTLTVSIDLQETSFAVEIETPFEVSWTTWLWSSLFVPRVQYLDFTIQHSVTCTCYMYVHPLEFQGSHPGWSSGWDTGQDQHQVCIWQCTCTLSVTQDPNLLVIIETYSRSMQGGFPYRGVEWRFTTLLAFVALWCGQWNSQGMFEAFDLSPNQTEIPLYSKFLGKPM